MADMSPHADDALDVPGVPHLTPGTLEHLVAVIELFAHDLEDMRANGYALGTQMVTRARAIARAARQVQLASPAGDERDALALIIDDTVMGRRALIQAGSHMTNDLGSALADAILTAGFRRPTGPTPPCICDPTMPHHDCPHHGMCAGYGHPCRCDATTARTWTQAAPRTVTVEQQLAALRAGVEIEWSIVDGAGLTGVAARLRALLDATEAPRG